MNPGIDESSDVVIRPLDPEDRTEVLAVLLDDGGFSRRVEGREARPTDADALLTPQRVQRRTTQGFGAFVDDRCVAVADLLMGWPDDHTAYVGLLQVRGADQGHGYGRLLQDGLVERAHAAGCATLRLTVVGPNVGHAQGFWEALGYRLTGEIRQWANDDGVEMDAHVMSRPVHEREGTP